MWTHTLDRRDEGDIEEEENRCRYFGLDNFPAVVLRTNTISAFAPVVVGQTDLCWSVSRVDFGRMRELTLQRVLNANTLSSLWVGRPAK